MTVKELMDQLGFPSGMGDLDESLKWALVELHLRRQEEKAHEHPRVTPADFDRLRLEMQAITNTDKALEALGRGVLQSLQCLVRF